MTGLSTTQKALVVVNELEFANQLNGFFASFERSNNIDLRGEILKTIVPSELGRIDISVKQVRNIFKRLNQRKARGPDNLSAYMLKTFADELAPAWQHIYKCSSSCLDSCCNEGLRKKIVVQELSESMVDKLDSQQFAYKHNRSAESAVVTLMHLVLKHLDEPQTLARALFFRFDICL